MVTSYKIEIISMHIISRMGFATDVAAEMESCSAPDFLPADVMMMMMMMVVMRTE